MGRALGEKQVQGVGALDQKDQYGRMRHSRALLEGGDVQIIGFPAEARTGEPLGYRFTTERK